MIHESNRTLYRGTQVVWYVLFVIEGLLIIRFLLQVLQANPNAFFTNLIYNFSDVLVLPFVAVFQNATVATSVFEWTTLLAMIVYWLLATAIVKLMVMSKSVSLAEADSNLSD